MNLLETLTGYLFFFFYSGFFLVFSFVWHGVGMVSTKKQHEHGLERWTKRGRRKAENGAGLTPSLPTVCSDCPYAQCGRRSQ